MMEPGSAPISVEDLTDVKSLNLRAHRIRQKHLSSSIHAEIMVFETCCDSLFLFFGLNHVDQGSLARGDASTSLSGYLVDMELITREYGVRHVPTDAEALRSKAAEIRKCNANSTANKQSYEDVSSKKETLEALQMVGFFPTPFHLNLPDYR